ncbi:transposase [Chondromyces apiculatus]|uniref:transposase n=1 Tax=Chondromyces apiculatus TaxID=51 RepID=UPI003520E05F
MHHLRRPLSRCQGRRRSPHAEVLDLACLLADQVSRPTLSIVTERRLIPPACARKGRAQQTSSNPTDQGKLGLKEHAIVDRNGIPLGTELTAANRKNSKCLADTLDALVPIRCGGRACRKRIAKLHADKAYNHCVCRQECPRCHTKPRIPRRGIESRSRLRIRSRTGVPQIP